MPDTITDSGLIGLETGESNMKAEDVKLGRTYVAKVNRVNARVRIDKQSEYNDATFYGQNLESGRKVKISAGQIKREVEPGDAAQFAKERAARGPSRDQIMRECGLVKVRGTGKVYWE